MCVVFDNDSSKVREIDLYQSGPSSPYTYESDRDDASKSGDDEYFAQNGADTDSDTEIGLRRSFVLFQS